MLAFGGLLVGCGGDDEDDLPPAATVPAEPAPRPITTPPPETTPSEPARDPDTEPRTIPPEEAQGDEEPIRSEAVFTGAGGKLKPAVVQVPAFIAIRVILRSNEAGPYSLSIGGKRLRIGPGAATAEAELPGLLPNKSHEGKSRHGDVRIVASAEPGP